MSPDRGEALWSGQESPPSFDQATWTFDQASWAFDQASWPLGESSMSRHQSSRSLDQATQSHLEPSRSCAHRSLPFAEPSRCDGQRPGETHQRTVPPRERAWHCGPSRVGRIGMPPRARRSAPGGEFSEPGVTPSEPVADRRPPGTPVRARRLALSGPGSDLSEPPHIASDPSFPLPLYEARSERMWLELERTWLRYQRAAVVPQRTRQVPQRARTRP